MSVFTASQLFFGLLHISVSSLPVFTFLSLYYVCFFSFSLNLLPLCTIATSTSPLLLSDIFSKLRSEASCCCLIWAVSSVLITTRRDRNVLAGCVHTNRGMQTTEQRVRKCWRLKEIYIFYIYSRKLNLDFRRTTNFLNPGCVLWLSKSISINRFGHWWAGLLEHTKWYIKKTKKYCS